MFARRLRSAFRSEIFLKYDGHVHVAFAMRVAPCPASEQDDLQEVGAVGMLGVPLEHRKRRLGCGSEPLGSDGGGLKFGVHENCGRDGSAGLAALRRYGLLPGVLSELGKRFLERLFGSARFEPSSTDNFGPCFPRDPDVKRRILGEHSPAMAGISNLTGWELVHDVSLLPLAVAFHGLHGFSVPQIERTAPW